MPEFAGRLPGFHLEGPFLSQEPGANGGAANSGGPGGPAQDPLAPRRGPLAWALYTRLATPDRERAIGNAPAACTSTRAFDSTVIPTAAHWVITPGAKGAHRAECMGPPSIEYFDKLCGLC
jgi:hypothetical protein